VLRRRRECRCRDLEVVGFDTLDEPQNPVHLDEPSFGLVEQVIVVRKRLVVSHVVELIERADRVFDYPGGHVPQLAFLAERLNIPAHWLCSGSLYVRVLWEAASSPPPAAWSALRIFKVYASESMA